MPWAECSAKQQDYAIKRKLAVVKKAELRARPSNTHTDFCKDFKKHLKDRYTVSLIEKLKEWEYVCTGCIIPETVCTVCNSSKCGDLQSQIPYSLQKLYTEKELKINICWSCLSKNLRVKVNTVLDPNVPFAEKKEFFNVSVLYTSMYDTVWNKIVLSSDRVPFRSKDSPIVSLQEMFNEISKKNGNEYWETTWDLLKEELKTVIEFKQNFLSSKLEPFCFLVGTNKPIEVVVSKQTSALEVLNYMNKLILKHGRGKTMMPDESKLLDAVLDGTVKLWKKDIHRKVQGINHSKLSVLSYAHAELDNLLVSETLMKMIPDIDSKRDQIRTMIQILLHTLYRDKISGMQRFIGIMILKDSNTEKTLSYLSKLGISVAKQTVLKILTQEEISFETAKDINFSTYEVYVSSDNNGLKTHTANNMYTKSKRNRFVDSEIQYVVESDIVPRFHAKETDEFRQKLEELNSDPQNADLQEEVSVLKNNLQNLINNYPETIFSEQIQNVRNSPDVKSKIYNMYKGGQKGVEYRTNFNKKLTKATLKAALDLANPDPKSFDYYFDEVFKSSVENLPTKTEFHAAGMLVAEDYGVGTKVFAENDLFPEICKILSLRTVPQAKVFNKDQQHYDLIVAKSLTEFTEVPGTLSVLLALEHTAMTIRKAARKTHNICWMYPLFLGADKHRNDVDQLLNGKCSWQAEKALQDPAPAIILNFAIDFISDMYGRLHNLEEIYNQCEGIPTELEADMQKLINDDFDAFWDYLDKEPIASRKLLIAYFFEHYSLMSAFRTFARNPNPVGYFHAMQWSTNIFAGTPGHPNYEKSCETFVSTFPQDWSPQCREFFGKGGLTCVLKKAFTYPDTRHEVENKYHKLYTSNRRTAENFQKGLLQKPFLMQMRNMEDDFLQLKRSVISSRHHQRIEDQRNMILFFVKHSWCFDRTDTTNPVDSTTKIYPLFNPENPLSAEQSLIHLNVFENGYKRIEDNMLRFEHVNELSTLAIIQMKCSRQDVSMYGFERKKPVMDNEKEKNLWNKKQAVKMQSLNNMRNILQHYPENQKSKMKHLKNHPNVKFPLAVQTMSGDRRVQGKSGYLKESLNLVAKKKNQFEEARSYKRSIPHRLSKYWDVEKKKNCKSKMKPDLEPENFPVRTLTVEDLRETVSDVVVLDVSPQFYKKKYIKDVGDVFGRLGYSCILKPQLQGYNTVVLCLDNPELVKKLGLKSATHDKRRKTDLMMTAKIKLTTNMRDVRDIPPFLKGQMNHELFKWCVRRRKMLLLNKDCIIIVVGLDEDGTIYVITLDHVYSLIDFISQHGEADHHMSRVISLLEGAKKILLDVADTDWKVNAVYFSNLIDNIYFVDGYHRIINVKNFLTTLYTEVVDQTDNSDRRYISENEFKEIWTYFFWLFGNDYHASLPGKNFCAKNMLKNIKFLQNCPRPLLYWEGKNLIADQTILTAFLAYFSRECLTKKSRRKTDAGIQQFSSEIDMDNFDKSVSVYHMKTREKQESDIFKMNHEIYMVLTCKEIEIHSRKTDIVYNLARLSISATQPMQKSDFLNVIFDKNGKEIFADENEMKIRQAQISACSGKGCYCKPGNNKCTKCKCVKAHLPCSTLTNCPCEGNCSNPHKVSGGFCTETEYSVNGRCFSCPAHPDYGNLAPAPRKRKRTRAFIAEFSSSDHCDESDSSDEIQRLLEDIEDNKR